MQYFSIVFDDGNELSDRDLSNQLPFSMVRADPEYIKLCETYAGIIFEYGSNDYATCVNLFALKSKYLVYIFSLFKLINSRKIQAVKFKNFDPVVKKKIDEFGIIAEWGKLDVSPLGLNIAWQMIAKCFIYNLFWMLGKIINKGQSNPNEVQILSWADDAYILYGKYYPGAMVNIFPFGVNIFRGLNYIIFCFRNFPSVKIAGVRFSFLLAIKLLFTSRLERVEKMVEFESKGWLLFAKSIESAGTFLCSDDFLVTQYIFSKYLITRGAVVIGKTHGVNIYCPYVHYSSLGCLTNIQIEFYGLRSPNTPMHLICDAESGEYNKYSDLSSFELLKKNASSQRYSIVIIDPGVLSEIGLRYESHLYRRALKSLHSIAGTLPVYIKFHPNRTRTDMTKILKSNYRFRVLKSFIESEHSNEKFIFINLYSTSYFECRNYGGIVFISDQFFNPKILFGSKIETVGIEELEKWSGSMKKIEYAKIYQ